MNIRTVGPVVGSTRRRGFWGFIGGAYANRRYTRLTSSIILGAAVTVAMIVVFLTTTPPSKWGASDGIGMTIILGWTIANAVLFPLAREQYYRATQPIRDGLSGIFMWGILAIVYLVARLAIFVYLWGFAWIIGLVGLCYLGTQDANGRGWRIDG
ncbi:hypothetical protein [Microbacterium karelineae]|uniref:hypothetical protein n=1 Tax=Microbacterium karelineae TaxID=2654283 RepID=UPI0012E9C68C|nr:hypothetical protein [Microbacterium karelineae]